MVKTKILFFPINKYDICDVIVTFYSLHSAPTSSFLHHFPLMHCCNNTEFSSMPALSYFYAVHMRQLTLSLVLFLDFSLLQ